MPPLKDASTPAADDAAPVPKALPTQQELIEKLADDQFAVTFRSLGEYRVELLKFARGE